jgi:hypothetical protein
VVIAVAAIAVIVRCTYAVAIAVIAVAPMAVAAVAVVVLIAVVAAVFGAHICSRISCGSGSANNSSSGSVNNSSSRYTDSANGSRSRGTVSVCFVFLSSAVFHINGPARTFVRLILRLFVSQAADQK